MKRAGEYYLRQLLAAVDSDVRKAVAISGLSRARFYALIKKYRLQKDNV